jgi:catechol 2,3-dioxygenase-like lactoylglutathione lyase family enzyme
MTRGPESFRLTAVTIVCTDLARSEQFYREVLGATAEPRDGYGCKWFRLGSQLINLMPNAVKKCPAEFPTDAMPIFWLEVHDLDAAYQQLVDRGVDVLQPPDGQSMLIADPDGLVLEIWKSV